MKISFISAVSRRAEFIERRSQANWRWLEVKVTARFDPWRLPSCMIHMRRIPDDDHNASFTFYFIGFVMRFAEDLVRSGETLLLLAWVL
ncbi:MAG TPA: hypothetical protein VFQ44_10915 [Streptosporangiaceae bacterium]|nr:hypothetical protein [Streptosporangiaceae bacterium]